MAYRTQHERLAPGDSLVCFSDGVTEATDAAGALFGEERLVDFLARQINSHPTELLGAVIAEVDAYMALAPMADDVTLLVLRYNGSERGLQAWLTPQAQRMRALDRLAAGGVEQSAGEVEDRRQFDELVFGDIRHPAHRIDHQHADCVPASRRRARRRGRRRLLPTGGADRQACRNRRDPASRARQIRTTASTGIEM